MRRPAGQRLLVPPCDAAGAVHPPPITAPCAAGLAAPAGVFVTASWDSTMCLWDPRLPPGQCLVATVQLPGKAYSLSVGTTKVVAATSGRHVWMYDLHT
jgi:hypothetical protein